MTVLLWIFLPLHILVCLILICVVLLQTGKGADMAGVFGGGGTQTAFGPRGVENTLSRLTKYSAVLFMVTSLGLSIVKSEAARSGFEEFPEAADVTDEASGVDAAASADAAAPPAEEPAGGEDAAAAPEGGGEPPSEGQAGDADGASPAAESTP